MNKLMSSVVPKNSMIKGTVQKIELDVLTVVSNGVPLRAKKAFSCLVEPLVNDKVSLFIDTEDVYITAILERKENSVLEIVAENGISLIAKDGDITLNTEQSINSFSQKANVVISEVSFLSTVVTLKSKTMNIITDVYQGLMDNVTLRHKSLNKFVDGHEEHQSLSSRRVIKGSDIHQVEESITTVDGQMKIDAKLINIS